MEALTCGRIPKPMLSLNKKPMLEWQIEEIKKYGIDEIVIITGYLGEQIEQYFKDGESFGVRIHYIREREALGSAGALYYVRKLARGRDFLLVFGDVMFEVDLDRFIDFHEKNHADVTLLAHPNSHPYDSDLLVVNGKNQVTGICKKGEERIGWYDNLVNAGMFLFSPHVLETVSSPKAADLERDVVRPLLKRETVFAYRTPEFVKDTGVPERFFETERAFADGIVQDKCLKRKQKCIFLDRDGTLNVFRGLLYDEKELELEKGATQALRRINASGYLAILVTNQPVVARGLCDEEQVRMIHRKLQTLLGQEGAYLDGLCFCPHHPDRGYPEENTRYKIPCSCRKPATGMLDQMIAQYNIDASASYMIGDSTVDIMTGINAGLKTILVGTGEAGRDGKYDVTPDVRAESLLDAVEQILGGTVV